MIFSSMAAFSLFTVRALGDVMCNGKVVAALMDPAEIWLPL
jgi:hypothetical protein